MSDSEVVFEGDEAPEVEVQVLEDGQEAPKEPEKAQEEAPKGKTLTLEEYEALKAGNDSVGALTKGFERLGESLQRPAPVVNAAPQVGPTDQELEEMAFKPNGFAQAVRQVAASVLGQQQGGFNQAIVEQNKRLLKLDPQTKETFTRYEAEIEKRYQALPAQYRLMPTIYEQIHKQVVFEKQDEIINERAGALAKQEVEKALAAAGIKPGVEKGKAPAMYQEGATSGAPAPKPKKTVYITKADVQDMLDRGMDPKDKDQVDAYVRYAKRGGK